MNSIALSRAAARRLICHWESALACAAGEDLRQLQGQAEIGIVGSVLLEVLGTGRGGGLRRLVARLGCWSRVGGGFKPPPTDQRRC